MSDDEDSPLSQLKAKHRQEKKDLKDTVLAMKKAAKCGNKQKQKDATAEIERLELEMKTRHEKELSEFEASTASAPVEKSPSTNESEPSNSGEAGEFYKEVAISGRNQKRKAKKEEERQRMKEAVAKDRENANSSLKTLEHVAVTKVLSDRHLRLVDINPDGDCLYNAIAHQFSKSGTQQATGVDMRRRAARFILANPTDFLPFLANDEGGPLDEMELEAYCAKIESDSAHGGVWGGEPEIIALSRSLERKIEVIQPEGRVLTFGDEFSTKPLVIVYLRHAYNLGEHYDSTEVITAS